MPTLMENFPGALHLIPDPTGLDAEQHAVSAEMFDQAGLIVSIVASAVPAFHHAYG